MKILLASASPRRKQLLEELLNEKFTIKPCDCNESYIGSTPEDTVLTIVQRKFDAVINKTGYDLIITADTIVYLDNHYFGKPRNLKEAQDMLSVLSGKTHQVYSGVLLKTKDSLIKTCTKTNVTFKKLSNQEIIEYIKTHEVLDKAGAYAVQDGVLVESIEGSYSNVVGFPKESFIEIIKQVGQEHILNKVAI